MTARERRESILAAARTEFARAGYHGASTASISRAAGCSEPMLYKHFAGKQDLFTSVLAQVSAIIEHRFDAVLSAEGSLVDNLLAALPEVMRDPAYVEALQLRKLAVTIAHEPQVHDTLAGLEERHHARVAWAVDRAKQQGGMRQDVDPSDVAWMWTGLMLAGCYREALQPGGFEAMLSAFVSLLEGLRP